MKKIITLLFLATVVLGYAQTHQIADEYWNKAVKAEESQDWKNAAILFEKSANAEKKSSQPRPEDFIAELSRTASSYLNINQYKKALPLYLESYEITEKVLGIEHKKYSFLINKLAFIYYKQKQYEKALPLCLEALRNAQMHLMTYNDGQFKNPKYWAPFILIGKP